MRLVEAAREGCRGLVKAQGERGPDSEPDLECPQCSGVLFEPTTLEDGATVCGPCVRRRREGRAEAALPLWAPRPEATGFGASPNVVITELARRFAPEAQATAAARQRANGLFNKGKVAEAAEAYSAAMAEAPAADAVLHCNRSAARLRLGDAEGARVDALAALGLFARRGAVGPAGPGGGMWAKAWWRLGQALLASEPAAPSAAFALALACGGPGAPLEVPAELVQAAGGLLAAPEAERWAGELEGWLRRGACPALRPEEEEEAPAGAAADRDVLWLMMRRSDTSAPDEDAWVREQLECALCVGLLFEPATAPCGHTFCRPCLARLLDHAFDTSPACPMCRADLSAYLCWLNARAAAAGGAFGSHGGEQIAVNWKLQRVLDRHFGSESAERRRQSASEEAAADNGGEDPEIPIFVCSLAVPGAPCPLHIFEPRYRLMMRRCIESGQRQFGMCLFPGADYGTMLRIMKFEQLPDGRSAIQTVGARRFHVLRWGQKDGYATGRVQWVEDEPGEPDEPMPGDDALAHPSGVSPEVWELRLAVERLMQKVGEARRPDIERQLGPVPAAEGADGPHCPALVFWCIGLPIFSPERSYELLFGEGLRRSPAWRLRAVLGDLRERMPACFEGGPGEAEAETGEPGASRQGDGGPAAQRARLE